MPKKNPLWCRVHHVSVDFDFLRGEVCPRCGAIAHGLDFSGVNKSLAKLKSPPSKSAEMALNDLGVRI